MFWREWSGLKGLNNKAQGNALGLAAPDASALKGRNRISFRAMEVKWHAVFRPFRAWFRNGPYSQGVALGCIIGAPLGRRAGWNRGTMEP